MKVLQLFSASTLIIAVIASALAAMSSIQAFLSIVAYPFDTLVFCVVAFMAAGLHFVTQLVPKKNRSPDFRDLTTCRVKRQPALRAVLKLIKRLSPATFMLACPFFIWIASGHELEEAKEQVEVWVDSTVVSDFPVGKAPNGKLWWVVQELPNPLAGNSGASERLVAYEPSKRTVTYSVTTESGVTETRERTLRIVEQVDVDFSSWDIPTKKLASKDDLSPLSAVFPAGDYCRFLVRPSSRFATVELVSVEVRTTDFKALPTISGVDPRRAGSAGVDDLFVAKLSPKNIGKGFMPASKFGSLEQEFLRTWIEADVPHGVTLVACTSEPGIYTYDVRIVTRRFDAPVFTKTVLEKRTVAFTAGPREYFFDAAILPGSSEPIPRGEIPFW